MELSDYRARIDQIDRQLVELFAQRMNTAAGIVAYKKEHGLPVLDPVREREKLLDVAAQAPEDMRDYTASLYTMLFELSRCYQGRLLGSTSPLTTEIQTAIDQTPNLFPSNVSVACQGVAGGVLPLENSTAGSVNAIYDLMMKHDFRIVRSVRLKVDHNLLVKPGTKRSDITEIYSHQQALSQCEQYLQAFPDVKVIPCENTAVAAQKVAEGDGHAAALSSRSCMKLYGLECLEAGVQDQGSNFTRFICISKNLEIYPGADRTSLMAVLPHEPGSLCRVLSRFYALGLNLNKLESRPMPERNFEFMFYFDLETPVYAPEFLQLMGELPSLCEEFSYLGSYSEVV